MVGCAPSTRGEAPWGDTSWELWSQSEACQVPRMDRWFELMSLANLKAGYTEYFAWLGSQTNPIYMKQHFDEIPASVELPRQELEDNFFREFMSSTVAWMLGMAVKEHMEGKTVEVIGLWGYDMAMDQEWASQRAGIMHMVWIAKQQGIAVYIPKGSDLALSPMSYPFFTDDPLLAKTRARMRDIQGKLHAAKAELHAVEQAGEKARAGINYLNGAMEQLNYEERRMTGSIRPI